MTSALRLASLHTDRRRAAPLTRSFPSSGAAAALLLLLARAAALGAQQPAPAPTSASAIRDTVAAIFRQPAYDRSLRESTWDRFVGWLVEWIRNLLSAVRGSRSAYWTTVAIFTVIILAVIGRAAYLGYLQRDQRAEHRGEGARAAGRGGRDPWLVAQELAAAGNHTDAAHALYRALLEALARRERVRLHPSKTVGDYVRDLRQRSSTLFTRFRDFARSYETVVYGMGHCDRERYERLHALAAPIVQNGAEVQRG